MKILRRKTGRSNRKEVGKKEGKGRKEEGKRERRSREEGGKKQGE